METDQRTVIVDAKIIDNFVESSKNVAYWRQQMKEAQSQGREYKGDINEIARELAKANNQYRESKKVIESSTRAEDLLNKTSDNTIKTLGEMQRELTALRSVPLNILPEDKAAEVKQRMADLMATIDDVKAEIKGLDTGAVWQNAASGLQFVTSSAQVLGQSLNALGVDSEWSEKLQSSTLELIGATQALGTVVEYLEKKKYRSLVINLKTIQSNVAEAVSLKTLALRSKGAAVAENLLTAAKNKGVVASKAAAAGAWLINAALAVNPVVWIAAAVVALTAGIWGLTKAFGGAADAIRIAEAATKQYEKQTVITEKAIGDINRKREQAVHDASIAGRKEIEELKKNGASKERIAQAEYEMNTKVRDAEYKALMRNRGEYWNQIQDAKAYIAVLEKQQQKFNIDSKNWNKLKDQIDEAKKSLISYIDLYASTGRDVQSNLQDQADAEIDHQKSIADATYNRLLKSLDQQKSFNESRIKAEAGYQSEDFATRQQYAKRLQDLANQTELERLTLARKYGKITQAEYMAQLSVLNNATQEFANTQAKEANAYYAAQREGILSIFDQTAQEQIDKVNEKYEKALKQLNDQNMRAPDASAYKGGTDNEDYQKAQAEYEDFLFRRAEIAYRLEQQKQEEIADIEENSLRRRAEKIENAISREYDGDLRKYQANERKKTEITIEQLEAQKRAKEKEGLDTYDEDAALLESRRQLNQMDLDADLLAAGENARAKYEARKAYLDQEMALAAANADRQMELNAEMLANEQEYMQARIEAAQKWADASMQLMSGVNDLFNALDDAKLQKAQEGYDKESEMLKEQLDNGYITQEEYDKKQKDLDKNLEKEQKKIARQQAIREKAMSMFQIAIDTATGIMKAVAASPLTGGMPWSAIVSAVGAVQLAAVAAQPLPKAARGRKINGKSHAQGGELVVAEDGEIIMNKRSVSMFEPLLSEISVAGGGVPFSSHIPDGGYTARWATSNTLSKDDIRSAMADAVKDVKVYTAITDIRREDGNYTTVESRGTI